MEEPNALLRWTIFLFGGGDAAIYGATSIAVIAILSVFPVRKKPIRPLVTVAVFAIGLTLIVCSSPPVPIWFQFITLAWIVFVLINLASRTRSVSFADDRAVKQTTSTSSVLLFLIPFAWLLTAFAIELPYHFWLTPTQSISTLLIIGDSVTAGLNDGEETWPKQLPQAFAVDVLDASQPGATLRSAGRQNSLFSDRAGFVVLEIGGNDMLEGLPISQFESDLDQLLTNVVRPDRTVVMFELPLPPLCAAYGKVQRSLSARHHVKLIPKRVFATVLTTTGATVDGIHLSARGQTQMKETIHTLLGKQLRSGPGTYQRLERGDKRFEPDNGTTH